MENGSSADKNTNRRVLILYGSETGNAQDFAVQLSQTCRRLRLQPVVMAMDDYNIRGIVNEKVVLVICSTTGQGDLPRNAQRFWKSLLKKKLPRTLLSEVHISTFGLGDSTYPKFNWAIRKIHRRLLQLGAKEICARGEADERSPSGHSMDEAFFAWIEIVSESLLKEFGMPPGVNPLPESELLPPQTPIQVMNSKLGIATSDTHTIGCSRPGILHGKVISNQRLTADDHFQDVRHFVFEESTGIGLEYFTGDTAALYPANDPDDVDALILSQGWESIADKRITLGTKSLEHHLVNPLTLRSFITHHLDIISIPRMSFFSLLRFFTSDPMQKEKLEEFASIPGQEELYNYANRPRRSILETILEFDTVRIPVAYLADLIPPLHPRLFSIASACQSGSGRVDLLVAIVKYKTLLRRIRRGVCTRWIEQLEEGSSIPFQIHRSLLRVPSPQLPILMVGPGTGVAAMRAIIQDRASQDASSQGHGPMTLFFGCRNPNKDYYFQHELKDLQAKDPKFTVYVSFSRPDNEAERKYVQDMLWEKRDLVKQYLVEKRGVVYVCGSSGSMPRQVRQTLFEIFKDQSGMDDNQSTDYLEEMERSNRYLQETW